MFEEYIEQNYQKIINSIENYKKFKYIREILEIEELEDCYKQYLSAEVNWWIYQEKLTRKNHPNFDFEALPAQNILNALDEIYFDIARFTAKDLKLALHNAIKVRLNYLCRPQTTLKWFVFRGEPTKTISEILLRLDYFWDYEYLKNSIIDVLKNTNLNNPDTYLLSVIDFVRIIQQCDNEHILNLTPTQFVDILDPLFDFMNVGYNATFNKVIPIPAFIIFLTDKSITQYPELFYELYERKELIQATKKDIVNAIIDMLEKYSIPEEPQEETHLNFAYPTTAQSQTEEPEKQFQETHSEGTEDLEIKADLPEFEEAIIADNNEFKETPIEKPTEEIPSKICNRGMVCIYDVFQVSAQYTNVFNSFIDTINDYRNSTGYNTFSPTLSKEILNLEFLPKEDLNHSNQQPDEIH